MSMANLYPKLKSQKQKSSKPTQPVYLKIPTSMQSPINTLGNTGQNSLLFPPTFQLSTFCHISSNSELRPKKLIHT